jgi:hypothetical protein
MCSNTEAGQTHEGASTEAGQGSSADSSTAEIKEHKVLLQNLPEYLRNESALHALLVEAQIMDVVSMAFRSSGKALITFGSYPSVQQCISCLRGRQLCPSQGPVIALYVRTVQKDSVTKPSTLSQTEHHVNSIGMSTSSTWAPDYSVPDYSLEHTPALDQEMISNYQSYDMPRVYKVLLQNLPEPLVKECMLRVMLEQFGLADIVDMDFQDNSRAVISFGSYNSVLHCINHFSGSIWNQSHAPVIARFVRTVEPTDKTGLLANTKTLSAEAPTFVPKSKQVPHMFSPEAREFVPGRGTLSDHSGTNTSTGADAALGTTSSDKSVRTSSGCESDLDPA